VEVEAYVEAAQLYSAVSQALLWHLLAPGVSDLPLGGKLLAPYKALPFAPTRPRARWRDGVKTSVLPDRRPVAPLVGFIGSKRFLSDRGDWTDIPWHERVHTFHGPWHRKHSLVWEL
jgi:hypothetical protein